MFGSKLRENANSKGTSGSEMNKELANIGKSTNGAMKYTTTENAFVDQFMNLGKFKKPRTFDEVESDCIILWNTDKELFLKFLMYIRMITRVTKFKDHKTATTQKGAGLKHEAIMRMLWLYTTDKLTFYQNLELFISVGSWKDIIVMLSYDLKHHGWNNRVLDWKEFQQIIEIGLSNPNSCNLLKKYLPQIRSKAKLKTPEAKVDNDIAKWIANFLFEGKNVQEAYRKLKTSGTAHQWQQLISQRQFNQINFDTIHGRALAQLVNSKFLENAKLVSKYEDWISKKPIAKYTGFVHELFYNLGTRSYQIATVNAQFMNLVEIAKKDANLNTSMIAVLDISGSMNSKAYGTNMTSAEVGRAIALFFSYLLPEGKFANSLLCFSRSIELMHWSGNTPVEKFKNFKRQTVGNTNFQSVIDFFTNLKPIISESEFPTGIICISDMEFDSSEVMDETNIATAKNKLLAAGFSQTYVDNFKFVFWNIYNNFYGDVDANGAKLETSTASASNVFYFGGYDPSVLTFLTGAKGSSDQPTSASDLFFTAMDQEILNFVVV